MIFFYWPVYFTRSHFRSQDSSIGIVNSLQAGCFMVHILGRDSYFSLLQKF